MENKEPNRDDAAEQDARSIEYAEKAEQLLKLQRQNKILTLDPALLIGIPTVYLLLVTALAGIGVLAFYRHHDTTAEIFLFVSVALVLLIPIAILGYFLWAGIAKKSTGEAQGKQRVLERILKTPVANFLARFGSTPIVRLFSFVLPVVMITLAITDFPARPRSSLLSLVLFTVLFVITLVFEIVRSLETEIRKQFKQAWAFNDKVAEVLSLFAGRIVELETDTKRFAEITEKYINDTAASDSEIHKHLITAIKETGRSVHDLHTFTSHLATKLLVDSTTPTDPLDTPKAEEHNEPEPPITSNRDIREEK